MSVRGGTPLPSVVEGSAAATSDSPRALLVTPAGGSTASTRPTAASLVLSMDEDVDDEGDDASERPESITLQRESSSARQSGDGNDGSVPNSWRSMPAVGSARMPAPVQQQQQQQQQGQEQPPQANVNDIVPLGSKLGVTERVAAERDGAEVQ